MEKKETTNEEILESINNFASDIESRFDEVDKKFDNVNKRMATKEDVKAMELRMLDHMDNKFADFEGITVTRQRKQDNKVNKILELLNRHNVAPKDEIKAIQEMYIFPPATME